MVPDVPYFSSWYTLTDGVAEGTDLVISETDPTKIVCVIPGVYLVSATAGIAPTPASDSDRMTLLLSYNGNAAGPAYYLPAHGLPNVSTDGGNAVSLPTIPLTLAAGDELRLQVKLEGGTVTVNCTFAYLTGVRVA